MSAYFSPRIALLKAGGDISKGMAVKWHSVAGEVVKAAAATDKCIGIAQHDVSSGYMVEVALPGGGGHALAQTTIAAGKLLVSHTDAKLKPIATAGDRVVAMAMESAVAGDIFAVEVLSGHAYTTES